MYILTKHTYKFEKLLLQNKSCITERLVRDAMNWLQNINILIIKYNHVNMIAAHMTL